MGEERYEEEVKYRKGRNRRRKNKKKTQRGYGVEETSVEEGRVQETGDEGYMVEREERCQKGLDGNQ